MSFRTIQDSSFVADMRDPRWERTSCLLCGGNQRSVLLGPSEESLSKPESRSTVVRCEACGLCYTNPRPTPAAMGEFYPPEYPPHQPPRLSQRSRIRAWWQRVFGTHAAQEIGFPRKGQDSLLDFGCGNGRFLQDMHAQGWRVLGVDVAPSVVLRIRDGLGLPALAGDLSLPSIRATSFDVITMRQSLEHVHDPLRTLREAYHLLTAGGRLYVSVPNIDSLSFRMFGTAWYGLDLPRHLTHFTPKTLRKMLVRAGFRPGRLRMVLHSSWLQRSARSARRLGRNPLGSWLFNWRLACRILVRLCAVAGRSDCISVWATKPIGDSR